MTIGKYRKDDCKKTRSCGQGRAALHANSQNKPNLSNVKRLLDAGDEGLIDPMF